MQCELNVRRVLSHTHINLARSQQASADTWMQLQTNAAHQRLRDTRFFFAFACELQHVVGRSFTAASCASRALTMWRLESPLT
eukprot:6179756-Pleurochrysis_carterae.AAC.1